MNCCINCFESNNLSAIFSSKGKNDNCDFCNSKNVYIYEASELKNYFVAIIDLYEVDYTNGKPLETQIIADFHKKIFTQKLIDSNNVKWLISEIIKEDIANYENLLNNPVQLKLHNSGAKVNLNQPLLFSWDNFSKEIKTVNRFHLKNSLDLKTLKSLFSNYQKVLPKGEKFYRARISDNKNGYTIEEMGNPPNTSAKSGRANPNGISYLYLAYDTLTTLYEVRATLYDYVTVGTFSLEENIQVVNLSRFTYDVFYILERDLDLEYIMVHDPFIDKLGQELSKPRRRSDSELDYLPTQYLSELIKSMGIDGIEFKSSLYENGVNLAIFNPDKFKGLEVSVYDIKNIKLEYTDLKLEDTL